MLDIKLKSNKKLSLFVVTLVIALLSIGYMSLYPTFENKAEGRYQDSLSGDDFLERLQRSNYVLYKEISEKTDGTYLS